LPSPRVCFHSSIRIIVVFEIFTLYEWSKLAVLTFFVVLIVAAIFRPVLLLVGSVGPTSLGESGSGETALLVQAPLSFMMVTHKLHLMVLSHVHDVMGGIHSIKVIFILVASRFVESGRCCGCLLSLHTCLIILRRSASFSLERREGTNPLLSTNLLPDVVVHALPEYAAALTFRIAAMVIVA
jgi:hypothetical protein